MQYSCIFFTTFKTFYHIVNRQTIRERKGGQKGRLFWTRAGFLPQKEESEKEEKKSWPLSLLLSALLMSILSFFYRTKKHNIAVAAAVDSSSAQT